MQSMLKSIALACLSLPGLAQESYWIANRASADLMQVTAWGSVLQRVVLPSAARSCITAPDGKVWVVLFGSTSFAIYDPSTSAITTVTASLGAPYDIAFDAQGDAWVSGGSGVERFSPAGASLGTVSLTAAAPLGICVDSQGNKWVAHRTVPPNVSRIDAGGVATTFPVTGATIQPVRPTADFRGIGQPSHIWLTGDPATAAPVGELVELDAAGNVLNVYVMPSSNLGGIGPVFDNTGNIWVGDFRSGALHQVDQTNGTVLNTYTYPPSANGLAVDSFNRLLVTSRITFAAPGPPCEMRRVNPANGAQEVVATLEIGGNSAFGSQAAVSTPQQFALVVDPLGDLDSDGVANFAEVQGNTSPIDPCSNANISINTTGSSGRGSTLSIDVQCATGSAWALLLSTAIVAPGSGLTLPGIGCEFLLDVGTVFFGAPLSGSGSTSIPLGIPNFGVGVELFAQGVVVTGSLAQFSNVTGLRVW